MFPESINKETRSVLAKIAGCALARQFYLAGGTALALQLGHRESADLDFFSRAPFDAGAMKEELAQKGQLAITSEDEKTLNGILDDIRVSFFEYPYDLLFPAIKYEKAELADLRDIAAMKLDAVSSRGSRKDFTDIYFIMRRYSLQDIIGFFEKKYSGIGYNKTHLLKSLVYFEDADREPELMMCEKVTWEEIKSALQRESIKLLNPEIIK